MELTPDQAEAYETIKSAFHNTQPVLLTGSAGTGKTTLTQFIAQFCMDHHLGVCGIAPTHKAAHVLSRTLNARCIMPIPIFTVASMLGKVREHSYIGSKIYGNRNTNKLNAYHIFILDEVSMTADDDVRAIVSYVRLHKKRLLLIGDDCQLPCPSAGYEINQDVMQKRNSYVFTSPDFVGVRLTRIVRQAAETPIIRMATFLRDHMYEDTPIQQRCRATLFPEDRLISYHDIPGLFCEKAEQYSRETVKVITYTNASMTNHNKDIRRFLKIDDCPFVVGDILMGYVNLGFPELIIENGQEYSVIDVRETTAHKIAAFSGLCGYLNDLCLINGPAINNSLSGGELNKVQKGLFFIHINHSANHAFMRQLIQLAKKVNSPRSTKMDYVRYMALKNMVLFMENVYSYQDQIYTEASFKETHPLLFTGISELIQFNTRTPIPSLKTEKIEQLYPGIVDRRLQDDKVLGESEQLADQFMVIEKDIYYGYAITSHKSQGSGYDCVIADENDFGKISDKWNYRRNRMESRIREKNQLRYVAYTRAKQELFIASNGEKEMGKLCDGDTDGEREKETTDDRIKSAFDPVTFMV